MNKVEELERKIKLLQDQLKVLKEEVEMNDPIYLMSEEEYVKYKSKIPPIDTGWWLRTISTTVNVTDGIPSAKYVNYAKKIVHDGSKVTKSCVGANGVRPVLNLKNAMKYADKMFYIGTKILFCGVVWIPLEDQLYIASNPIIFTKFDGSGKTYKESSIRKLLLEWVEARKDWENWGYWQR